MGSRGRAEEIDSQAYFRGDGTFKVIGDDGRPWAGTADEQLRKLANSLAVKLATAAAQETPTELSPVEDVGPEAPRARDLQHVTDAGSGASQPLALPASGTADFRLYPSGSAALFRGGRPDCVHFRGLPHTGYRQEASIPRSRRHRG